MQFRAVHPAAQAGFRDDAVVDVLKEKTMRLTAKRHADIDFKSVRPRQPAQALPNLREAGLVRVCPRREFVSVYARERRGAQDQPPRRRDLYS
jgi:hypothetical protein